MHIADTGLVLHALAVSMCWCLSMLMLAQVEVLEAGPAAAGDEELLDTVAGATLTSSIVVA